MSVQVLLQYLTFINLQLLSFSVNADKMHIKDVCAATDHQHKQDY